MYVIGFVIAIATCIAITSGEWGSVAVGALIIVFLLALGAESSKQDKAFNNLVYYWANGGKERRIK